MNTGFDDCFIFTAYWETFVLQIFESVKNSISQTAHNGMAWMFNPSFFISVIYISLQESAYVTDVAYAREGEREKFTHEIKILFIREWNETRIYVIQTAPGKPQG